MISDDLIEQRAVRAYGRRFGRNAFVRAGARTEILEKDGKRFVEIRNWNGPLAKYRVVPIRNGDIQLAYVPLAPTARDPSLKRPSGLIDQLRGAKPVTRPCDRRGRRYRKKKGRDNG